MSQQRVVTAPRGNCTWAASRHGQQAEGDDCPLLCEASLDVLHPGLRFPEQERLAPFRAGPKDGHVACGSSHSQLNTEQNEDPLIPRIAISEKKCKAYRREIFKFLRTFQRNLAFHTPLFSFTSSPSLLYTLPLSSVLTLFAMLCFDCIKSHNGIVFSLPALSLFAT